MLVRHYDPWRFNIEWCADETWLDRISELGFPVQTGVKQFFDLGAASDIVLIKMALG
jgi:hypothetical protein